MTKLTQKDRVLRALKKHGAMTLPEIERLVRLPKASISNYLHRLSDEGEVVISGQSGNHNLWSIGRSAQSNGVILGQLSVGWV